MNGFCPLVKENCCFLKCQSALRAETLKSSCFLSFQLPLRVQGNVTTKCFDLSDYDSNHMNFGSMV